MKKLRRISSILLAAAMFFCIAVGCAPSTKKTVSIELWHYYSGELNKAFDALVDEFNESVGKAKNIVIEPKSQGSTKKLQEELLKSAQNAPAAANMPAMFMSYADTALDINEFTPLADIKDYFTQGELSEYVEGYITEGTIGGKLMVFPVAKATETLIINKAKWLEFESGYNAANPSAKISLAGFETEDGIKALAEKFYEFSGGKAFYGRDSTDNYFFIGNAQLGSEVYTVAADDTITLGFDRETAKKLWDNYYVPYMKGWYSHVNSFGTDCVKNDETIAALGSTSASPSYPDMDLIVLPAPRVNATAKNIFIQQGAGICVTEAPEETERACAEFIKWFTEAERNSKFSLSTGYLPVKKDANSFEKIKVFADADAKESVLDNLKAACEMIERAEDMYTCAPFSGSGKIRKLFKDFTTKCRTDFALLKDLKTLDYELKLAELISEPNFSIWYNKTAADIQKILSETSEEL